MLKKIFFLIFLTILFLNSYSQKFKIIEPQVNNYTIKENHYPNCVFYEIFVQSFYDTNNDGIGDVNGIIKKLDYLSNLGIQAVWLMPVNPSPSYHKYDITDYCDIHPDYGTIEDFKTLVKEAHKRDIKIIIDLVVNHTSSNHPWFVEASKSDDNKYRGYYVWSSNKANISKEPYHWHYLKDSLGNELKDEKYYGFFWHGMPDLNYDCKELRKEIINIGKFWLNDINIDGFRLDAVRFFYPEEELQKNCSWWQQFRKEMDNAKPNFFMVGEVWGEDTIVAPFLTKGIHAGFNFDLSYAIIDAVNKQVDNGLVNRLIAIRNLYKSYEPDFNDAIFLTNHDQDRVMSVLSNDVDKAKVAASLLLTLPGSPFIYYGEEIGMRGKKPDEFIREPMIWDYDSTDKGQTYWKKPQYSTSKTIVPVSLQLNDENSIFYHYKKLIGFRKKSKAMTFGDIKPTEIKNIDVISFYREFGNESLLVICNVSKHETIINLSKVASEYNKLVFLTNGYVKITDNKIVVPACASLIFKK